MTTQATVVALLLVLSACSSLPTQSFERHVFPKKGAFVEKPDRPYVVLGQVKTKVNWPTLDPSHEESTLCKNYYNKAVKDLVKRAIENGGDGVAEIRSVVFLMDGKTEVHNTPECVDDGEEGQILLQGVAFRWKDKKPRTAAGGSEKEPELTE